MYEMLDSLRRLRQPFINGVHDFVSKAMNQVSYIPDGGLRCLCVKCCCEKILKPSHVKSHMLQHGFQPNYRVWVYHGETKTNEVNLNIASTIYDNIRRDDDFGSLSEMVNNAYMQESDIKTRYVNVIEDVEEQPNAEAQKFYDILPSTHQPIYDGATQSKFSIAIGDGRGPSTSPHASPPKGRFGPTKELWPRGSKKTFFYMFKCHKL